MDAAKGDSRLSPWRARWRELGTRVKGARRHPSEREGKERRSEVDAHTRANSDGRPNNNVAASTWMDAVEQARQDWMHARSYFDSVEDPDLIDHAIYQVQAAESKYMYLLRKVRENYREREGTKVAERSLAQSPSS